ncbi:6407_t:CDS:1 [Acaulospora colombiana]|uniref:6407_t:CDS:1 n=1 Tax=Acaulospora colombiana TaxID=27376 RepID=A0ACA9NIA8_9GLOM|nr:6407_t:CDS:1 [Acaulospora colombiana]
MAENQNPNVKIPFPPSITIEELVRKHIEKGIVNVNRASNAFFIYRIAYSREAIKLGFKRKDISKLASDAWRDEPKYVKEYYKRMETDIKSRLRIEFPICFVNAKSKKPARKKRGISNITTVGFDRTSFAMSDPSLKTMNPEFQTNVENADSFMVSLPKDLALTYEAIMQSLPF